MSSSVESAPVNAGDEPKDTLLQALVYLAEHEKVNYSVSSLVSGLPLVDGCLTPELFKRAAGRIGFGSSIEQRPLADIPELVMPCVLLQTNNRALVLLAYTRDESSAGASVRVFDPLLGRECVLPMASVLEDYSGFAIFTKIEAVYDPRAQPFLNFQRDHWFWSTLGHSSKIYRDVLVASFL
jgi:ABC-type bacteriocin/lantibiotic exporters, contain an N-terminal double-glycine peptidase domain